MNMDQLIRLLNLDLSWEYAAMIQYIQHASMLTGPEYVAIIQEELFRVYQGLLYGRRSCGLAF